MFPTGLRYRVLDSGRLTTKWNAFDLAEQIDTSELPPGSDPGAPVPADDVGFVDTMVADLRAELPIDGRRIYASGFSNGADFTARLSIDRSDKLAAAAYSGGALPFAASPVRAVPTLVTAGTDDPKIIEQVDPTLPALPLDPVEILTTAGLTDVLGRYHATFGLDPSLYSAVAEPTSTTFRWPARRPGVLVRDARGRPPSVSERRQQPERLRRGPRVLGLLPPAPPAVSHHTRSGRG